MLNLDSPITYLKGVGPERADVLNKELGIYSIQDLLTIIPFRFIDKTRFTAISEAISINGNVLLKGSISNMRDSGFGRKKRVHATFRDSSGAIDLVWFKGGQYLRNSVPMGQEVVIYGKVTKFGANYSVAHPEIKLLKDHEASGRVEPLYSTTEKASKKGLHSKGIHKLILAALPCVNEFKETLPQEILKRGLLGIHQAYRNLHNPPDIETGQRALNRFKYEEFFYLQLELMLRKRIRIQKTEGFQVQSVGDDFLKFYNNFLPFELTGAQKKVLKEIRADLSTGHQMNRLVQGDVGSGKTVVALLSMLIMTGNGKQTCMMAPTEILANQHYQGLKELLGEMPIRIALLTGSSRAKERREIHAGLEDGSIHILVGTHALIEDKVKFKDLGMAVIDEQHRFGVAQRAKLYAKNSVPPHVMVMTATPIPRTLAMSFYGDLDVSTIDELPPGRKPIATQHIREGQRIRLFSLLKQEIAKGRQVYIVYPLIDESETLDYANLMEGYESISRAFPLPEYTMSIVHGRMKAADKDYEMSRFAKGETNILVATTVIEVGVNVPNASVMVIESAERFGLSQLHQLRGRVGRGAEKSYCYLVTGNKLGKESKIRMETMVDSNDGFKIAEVDLKLRGPGDVMGTKQSGMLDLKAADLTKDQHILVQAREDARNILQKDPSLRAVEHKDVRKKIENLLKTKPNWIDIS